MEEWRKRRRGGGRGQAGVYSRVNWLSQSSRSIRGAAEVTADSHGFYMLSHILPGQGYKHQLRQMEAENGFDQ
ncbi:hypothetical protein JZ751_001912 [Albula glossodonta]|uniref:Uncharacterized protein n=1 Tax=Albula glossodonta TaxID=121402 RepID=A0A8T2PHA6_9TELE|nr:hypothetical protein JZ751_001912 [Albula glossodonta]